MSPVTIVDFMSFINKSTKWFCTNRDLSFKDRWNFNKLKRILAAVSIISVEFRSTNFFEHEGLRILFNLEIKLEWVCSRFIWDFGNHRKIFSAPNVIYLRSRLKFCWPKSYHCSSRKPISKLLTNFWGNFATKLYFRVTLFAFKMVC